MIDASLRSLPADACQRSAGNPGVKGRPFSIVILGPSSNDRYFVGLRKAGVPESDRHRL
jgi:hypothetical protein